MAVSFTALLIDPKPEPMIAALRMLRRREFGPIPLVAVLVCLVSPQAFGDQTLDDRKTIATGSNLSPTSAAQAASANDSKTETPTTEYQDLMRSMASIVMKPDPVKGDYSEIVKDAGTFLESFAKLERFWAVRNVNTALNFTKAGGKAATDLEAAANAKDDAGIAGARAALMPNCVGCHAAHAKRLPDRTLVITLAPNFLSGSASPGIVAGTGSGIGPPRVLSPGVYQPRNGVSLPVLLREVRPQYTAAAMRVKAQGAVIVECVVKPDGSVGDVTMVRSLDPVFGLDDEAIKAAGQWRFSPGLRQGEPVSVLVTIELTFTLR